MNYFVLLALLILLITAISGCGDKISDSYNVNTSQDTTNRTNTNTTTTTTSQDTTTTTTDTATQTVTNESFNNYSGAKR